MKQMRLQAIVIIALYAMALHAVEVDSPAPPTDPASAMFSLESIYNRLDTGASGAKRTGAFTDPTTGPVATLHTLNDVMSKAPSADNVNGATAAQVLVGRTYWSLVGNAWGQSTGAMPNNGGVTITPGTSAQTIALGFHDGTGTVTGDTNLLAANIKSGISIFGVAGNPSVVDTSTGTAAAGDILSGKKAFVNGASITGTMPNNGGVTIMPGTTNQTIALGYHDGTGKVNGDANLISANIKSGRSIFGVAGNTNVVDTSAGTAGAADLLFGKTAFVGGSLVTGAVPAGANVAGGNGVLSFIIPNGLYSGGKTATAADSNLVAANIKSGVNIFGVAGTAVFASGNATAANVLSGVTFSNSTANGVTGTMPNNGAVSLTPGTTAQAIAAGYHNGSGTVSGDANLVASNIKSGVSIFGVGGSVLVAAGNATANDVSIGKTFSNATAAGVTGTRPTAPVARSGQTQSLAAGDDGAIQKGVASPSPRFTDNGNGTVTDNLSGLIWLKNASAFGQQYWPDALTTCNSLVSGQAGLTDGSTAGQWRLPNIKELLSLVDYSRVSPALPPNPFTGVQPNSYYWASTTFASLQPSAWCMLMTDANLNELPKANTLNYVWPVRGGQ